MELTENVVSEGRLTALMVTQNMERALQHGDRLLMMHEQRIVLDIGSDEKAKLNVRALVERLERAGDGPKTVS
jgi:putative ABC transport system ATP-binding protein